MSSAIFRPLHRKQYVGHSCKSQAVHAFQLLNVRHCQTRNRLRVRISYAQMLCAQLLSQEDNQGKSWTSTYKSSNSNYAAMMPKEQAKPESVCSATAAAGQHEFIRS